MDGKRVVVAADDVRHEQVRASVAGADGQLLDRSADEALQLQEAAMRVGYGAAALPLWEEFLLRYFRYQARTHVDPAYQRRPTRTIIQHDTVPSIMQERLNVFFTMSRSSWKPSSPMMT